MSFSPTLENLVDGSSNSDVIYVDDAINANPQTLPVLSQDVLINTMH